MRTKQKILQISKSRLITFGFAIFVNVILAGSVCGTFAWYTYATRTGFLKEYHGTTVGDLGSLEAGFISNVRLSDYANYKLEEDDVSLADEGKIIYWSTERLEATTINYVIGANGSATTMMNPVTSASYDHSTGAEGFHLYQKPTHLFNYSVDPEHYTKSSTYVYIPFVLRFADESNPGAYLGNTNIYFTKCDIETSEDSNGSELYKSARLFMSDRTNGYIINPSADSDGTNNVGGILDLDEDGFYDYSRSGYEVIYGESVVSDYLSDVTEEDGDLPEEERTTFVANHKKGVHALNEATYQPKTVSYYSMSHFTSREFSVTKTDEVNNNLAYLDIFIYFEGWDVHAIDKEQGSGFIMNLEFGVDI